MEKILNNLAVNTLLFVIFTGLFVLPVFGFFTFNVASTNTQNVLGQTSLNVNGMSVVQEGKLITISGVVGSGQSVTVPLSVNVNDEQVYVAQDTQNIKVVTNENIVEIYNLSPLDQKVEVLLH